MAFRGEVTNLPNRYYVRDWPNQLFESEKGSRKSIAVLYIGIDSFGEINAKCGNQRGAGKTVFGLIELAVSQMHRAQDLGAENISVSEAGPEPEA